MKCRTNALIAIALAAIPLHASAQTVSLAGSDSWEPSIRLGFLTSGTRAPGADLGSFLGYTGGGQTPGETALKSTTSNQVIAFFTGQLTDSGTNSVCGTYPNAQDIVLGVDGILNVGHSGRFPSNPQVSGTPANVISILYTGFDPGNAAAGNDCNGSKRRGYISNYASVFTNSSIPANTPINHIYRRGDATATSRSFLQLLGIPTANQKYCNGTDNQDLDPIRRFAGQNDQVAEADGTLGVLLPIIIPTFSNNVNDLYVGSNGTQAAFFGKFLGGQGPTCTNGPSSIDPSSGAPGVAPSQYAGLPGGAPATLDNLLRCDCRYPVPNHFANPASPDARRFNWNVKLGIGCQAAQASAAPAWNVLNGDDGTSRENTPVAWGSRVTQAFQGLSSKQRCCNVGTPAAFRREDPRVLNLYLRDPATGALKPSAVAPHLAFYRLATTDKGLSNVGRTPFTTRCQQTIASDLQITCLVNNTPDTDSIGYGALPIYKDAAANSLPQPRAFNLNTDPTGNNYGTIRDRTYSLSRYIFLSSLKGFGALGESGTAHTGNAGTYNYDHNASAAQKQLDAQWNLAKAAYTDSKRADRANSAVESLGFLALNAGTDPWAVACTNDANSPTAPKITNLSDNTYFGK